MQLNRENAQRCCPPGENVYRQHQALLTVALPTFTRLWSEIPRDSIDLGKELGTGAFGVVRMGYMLRNKKTIPCAVKTVKSEENV